MLLKLIAGAAMTLTLAAGWVWVGESQIAIVDTYQPLKRVEPTAGRWRIAPGFGPNWRSNPAEWPILQIRSAEEIARGAQLLF